MTLARTVRGAIAAAALTLASVLLIGCGGDDEEPTATVTAVAPSATALATAAPQGGAAGAPTPPSISSAFGGLPLEQIKEMRYDAGQNKVVLVTYIQYNDPEGGQELCDAIVEVARFSPDAKIEVLSEDETSLATCSR